jgi:hypothetical protein
MNSKSARPAVPRVPQSAEELLQHLAEQRDFLLHSAMAYDRGVTHEAKRLAATIRVLVHDTPSSHSLMGQLGLLEQPFWETGWVNPPGNRSSLASLCLFGFGHGRAELLPLYDTPDGVPKPRQVSFSEWWNAVVLTEPKRGISLCRAEVVLIMANQDGGAHVDPGITHSYAEFSRANALGWMTTDARGTQPLANPERATVRQIAHELLRVLIPGYTCPCPDGYSYTSQVFIGPA